MTRPTLEEGYGFWREEVQMLDRPEKETPYIPVIALVGVYAVIATDPENLTSFAWRHSVLDSPNALAGIRLSLQSFHRDRIDDTFEIPLDYLKPDDSVMGGQRRHAFTSLLHGMPESVTALPENEVFLAEMLGYAQYDHGVQFYPHLGLTDQGEYAIQNMYPQTAEYIEGLK